MPALHKLKLLLWAFAAAALLAGCAAEVLPPEMVLRAASGIFERKDTVSIPLLRMDLELRTGEKPRSIFLSAQMIAKWPDMLRMKITKANYHLASLVINGHSASVHFPRTGKVFDTELNRPLLEGNAVDLIPTLIEMSMILLKGPFPEYPLARYTFSRDEAERYVFTTAIQGADLAVVIDPRTGEVLEQVYTLRTARPRTVTIRFGRYETVSGTLYPRKLTVVVTEGADKVLATIEMFASRLSFNRPAPDKAFVKDWPADAQVIEKLPENPEELFGKMEDEPEDNAAGE